MGLTGSKDEPKPTHKVYVTTGDRISSGTAWRKIDVEIVMTDRTGRESKVQTLIDHHSVKKGETEVYGMVLEQAEYIKTIKLRRTDTHEKQEWYVELVKVDYLDVDNDDDEDLVIYSSYFPIHRWLHHTDVIEVSEFDSVLPQEDPNSQERKRELEEKRDAYQYDYKIEGGPPLCKEQPKDERFTVGYAVDLLKSNLTYTLHAKLVKKREPTFESLADIESIYMGDHLHVPEGMSDWTEDVEFGRQRLTGTNPGAITLCQELPINMAKSIKDIEKNLPSGQSFDDCMKAKRVYMMDMSYLYKMECAEPMPGPVGLFCVADDDMLLPIAIQLTPEESAPVFTPKDPYYTWMAAKMWFNIADASIHQSSFHLGFTHLLSETACVAANRQLSQSHPVFRLLAPHMRFVIRINALAVSQLISDGGKLDQVMRIGHQGVFSIVKHDYANWSLQQDGNFLKNLKKRGVQDVKSLPNYHYRDDGKKLWLALHKYVKKAIGGFYGRGENAEKRLREDFEIQGWINELVTDCHVQDMPVALRDGQYYVETLDDLTEIVTVFIFLSSVQHAAVNFLQYDQYGFPPNYPGMLRGTWPTNKDQLREDDIVEMLPTKEQTFDMMTLTKGLSTNDTQQLGNFDVQFAYDPTSLAAQQELQNTLKDIDSKLAQKNKYRKDKYRPLMPRYVPNSISI